MSNSRDAWRDDPRAERVAARLRQVVLELAEERPIYEVGVAEISRLAQISRSTFYKHASSPAGLLKSVLTGELRDIRDAIEARLGGGERDMSALSRFGLGAVLDHVAQHEQVYRLALSENGSPELHRLLADHFRHAVLLVFQKAHTPAPHGLDPKKGGDDTWELFAAFVAGAYVEVIAAWLREPTRFTPGSIIELLLLALPGWMLTTPDMHSPETPAPAVQIPAAGTKPA